LHAKRHLSGHFCEKQLQQQSQREVLWVTKKNVGGVGGIRWKTRTQLGILMSGRQMASAAAPERTQIPARVGQKMVKTQDRSRIYIALESPSISL